MHRRNRVGGVCYSMAQPVKILHVEDEPGFTDLTKIHLERLNGQFSVASATTPEEGLAKIAENGYDCIVSDHDMPGSNGIQFLEAVREDYPNLPFILFTGKGSEEIAGDAISAGVTDYLQKEVGSDQYLVLANRIKNYVERQRAQKERETMIDRVSEAIVEVDANWRFMLVNDQAEELYDMSEADLLGRDFWGVFSAALDTRFEEVYRRVMKTREPESCTEFFGQLDGRFDIQVYPNDDGGLAFYFHKVTMDKERVIA